MSVPGTSDSQVLTRPEPYRMHSSQRYLDLTRKKVELTRTPRELPDDTQDQGFTLRNELVDPLLDFWLQTYDLRAEENRYNDLLPQYRLHLDVDHDKSKSAPDDKQSLRIHFVHRPSSHAGAIPLLICHDWGSSFIEPARMIEALCEPSTTPTANSRSPPAFHVICPSIPGFGFSDTSQRHDFGLQDTARLFHALMQSLGYKRFVLYGHGWGFNIGREIARQHAEACYGMYTVNPVVPPPTLLRQPVAYLQYHFARWTKARLSQLSFGYVPSDFDTPIRPSEDCHDSDTPAALKYGLADSPTCLLAFMLERIHPYKSDAEDKSKRSTVNANHKLTASWSPSDILTWTMLYWLSGTEAPFRWLRRAREETEQHSAHWRFVSNVPLGISHYSCSPVAHSIRMSCPPVWAALYQTVWSMRRHHDASDIRYASWEIPDQVVLDLRSFVDQLRQSSKMTR